MATATTKSMAKWKRKPADYYPSPVDGTESLMPVVQEIVPAGGHIWEPACGDGRMSRVLEHHGYEVTSTDLREHSGYGEGGLDFLNDDPMKKWGLDLGDVDMIVTNPPFALAEQFIRKALTITPNVAMLLKATYWNTKGRIGLFDECRPKLVLPLTWRLAFLEKERGSSPLMDCVWVVWHDGDEDWCAYEPLPRRVYPGYGERGLRGSLAALTEAIEDCATATRRTHQRQVQGDSE